MNVALLSKLARVLGKNGIIYKSGGASKGIAGKVFKSKPFKYGSTFGAGALTGGMLASSGNDEEKKQQNVEDLISELRLKVQRGDRLTVSEQRLLRLLEE